MIEQWIKLLEESTKSEWDETMRTLGIGINESLIPGIPDKIILAQIVPKLPWRAPYVLSLVSPAWRLACQCRDVYNARVGSKSLEQLILFKWCSPLCRGITLYSVRDDVYHELPPFPASLGILLDYERCKCIALDGKLYLLGAVCALRAGDESFGHEITANGTYELDLAGRGQWKQCARMKRGREDFACGVMNGKIYVFQGSSDDKPVDDSECYDPKLNAWSLLPSRKPLRFEHEVATVGGDFFLHGGSVFHPKPSDRSVSGGDSESEEDLEDLDEHFIGFPDKMDVYNPSKKRWRAAKLQRQERGILFSAQGKMFSMDDSGIDVYDTKRNSWASLHSHSFAAIELPPCVENGAGHSLTPLSVLFADGELFAIVDLVVESTDYNRCLFLRTKGLGENTAIVWRNVLSFPSRISSAGFDMSTIEL